MYVHVPERLSGLADVAEQSLRLIAEIADDRRQTLDGAKHHAREG